MDTRPTGAVTVSPEETVSAITRAAADGDGGFRPGRYHGARLSRRMRMIETTEMIVSSTDQVLIVSPTLIPKYSLTSQKPASLTWEKNSDPEPMASTSSAVWEVLMPVARGATMPDAEIVAMVAEPVARRMPTATSQPRTSAEMFTPSVVWLIVLATPESIRVCLKPQPAPTIRRIPAMGGSDSATMATIWSKPKPAPRPGVNIATMTAMSSANSGVPMASRIVRAVP